MIFAGGIRLKKGGEVVGAVGVSGGSGDQIMLSRKPAQALSRMRRSHHACPLTEEPHI
jgi:uncharacterized protein GlcG (DUF336 family)